MADRSNFTKPSTSKIVENGEGGSLYDQLQENKANKMTEFYEESKSEVCGRVLSDEDAKFLLSVEESKRKHENSIKKQTEAALHEFRVRQEFFGRDSNTANSAFYPVPESLQTSAAKLNEKLKTSAKPQANPTESLIKVKRNALGIAPKNPK